MDLLSISELVDCHGHHTDHPGCSAAVCQHYCRCAVLQGSAQDDERGTTLFLLFREEFSSHFGTDTISGNSSRSSGDEGSDYCLLFVAGNMLHH